LIGCGSRQERESMYRDIKKKRLILENRKPYSRETAAYMQELNIVDWTFSSLRLDGMALSRRNAERIVRGEFVVECSVRDHLAVRSHCDAIRMACDMADMNAELSEGTVMKLYKALYQEAGEGYRRLNPVIRSFDYVPPHFNEIGEQMALLFQWLGISEIDVDPIRKAAVLHNKFLEIYPFEAGSEAMARMAMQYELMRNGFPPVPLLMSEQEYNEAIIRYLKKEQSDMLYDMLLRGVFSKLELFMQLTAD